jgi:hypothetical protein
VAFVSFPSIPLPPDGGARRAAIRHRAVRVSHRARRPLFGRHGRKVIAGLCAYEVLALSRLTPLPTLTTISGRLPALKWALTLSLAHHLHLERSASQDDVDLVVVEATVS